MHLSRRAFVGANVAAAVASWTARLHGAQQDEPVSMGRLGQIAEEPVLPPDQFSRPLVIKSVELLQAGQEHFVRVRTRDGAEGISVTNSRVEYLHPILNRLVAPYFVGKDARLLESHLLEVYRFRSNYKLQGVALWCPVAWVEFAILDLLGRVVGKTIGQLLGTIQRQRVAYYIASERRDTTAEQEVEYLEELVANSGAKAVKFRLGGRMSRNADALPGRSEGLIRLAAERFGGRIALHGDANSSYDPQEAIRIGKLLEEAGAVFFEEPCPFDHLLDTKQVTDALRIPVAGGEQEFSQWRFRWSICNRVMDIVQPDLQYYGGLIRSTRVARMAAAAGMPTTPHISGGFGFVYMLHFASYTPEIGAYQEYKRGVERYGPWFNPPLTARDGLLDVPKSPGVGIAEPERLLRDARLVP